MARKIQSIQAESKKSRKSIQARLQAQTLKKAHRNGLPWTDEEVAIIVAGIQKDETTFDMAMSLGRSFYGVNQTRRMVGFAMRHSGAIWK